MVHHKAPHRNWMPAERHLGVFNDSVFPEPDNLFDDYKTRSMAPKEQDMSIAKTLTNYWDLKLATAKELEKEDFPDKRFKGVYARMPQPAKINGTKCMPEGLRNTVARI